MTVLAFPLHRRYVAGDRVAFETEAGERLTGTVMDQKEGKLRVCSDKGPSDFWRVPPEYLKRLDPDDVVLVEPPTARFTRTMMVRIAELYRALDPAYMNAKVRAGIEEGRWDNPREGLSRCRSAVRRRLTKYFNALGRPVSREEALTWEGA